MMDGATALDNSDVQLNNIILWEIKNLFLNFGNY